MAMGLDLILSMVLFPPGSKNKDLCASMDE